LGVSNLLIGALGVMLATNQPAALSNLVTESTGVSIPVTDTNSPLAQELHKIEEQDDTAAAQVDEWIRQNDEFAKKGAGIPKDELNQRIRNKFDASRTAYKDFIQRHPDYAPARVAYASFLHDMGDEDGEVEQLLKARDLDPKIPSVWNNLANFYGEHSPVTNAFACYEKAIQLDPKEPVYYDNFGTTVYLFRKDAREYYHINEQQVFDKALALYREATKLDPTNFERASDLAMSYYGIKPLRTNDALNAWTNALNLAHDDIEREGVYIHFARIAGQTGQFAAARKQLEAVTNVFYTEMKRRVTRSINDKEHPELVTNSPPEIETTEPTVGKFAEKTPAATNSPAKAP
jgi:tetratricopeptide (TPR) repeat protein